MVPDRVEFDVFAVGKGEGEGGILGEELGEEAIGGGLVFFVAWGAWLDGGGAVAAC